MMFDIPRGSGRLAAVLLLLSAAGCGDEQVDPDRSSLTGQPTAPAAPKDQPGTEPANSAGTTAPGAGKELPPCGTDPAAPLACKEDRGANGEVCKVCYDATGKEVVRSCAGTAPADAGKCWVEETKESVCKVCVDPNGKELVRACDKPSPGTSEPPARCQEEKGKNGEICKVCYDAAGKELARGCAGTTPSDANAKCWVEETKEAICKVCVDASGKETARACDKPSTGTVEPPAPAVRCEELAGPPELVCKICYDAKGTPVSKECVKR
jgi:hypothetical protein